MLALEIELLTGVYRAELPDHSRVEWPPHPERVFSALVQSWGDGGCDPAERRALEWLEALPPPLVEAEDIVEERERATPTVYVPPNDQRGYEINVLPARRPRQARNFRAITLSNPVMRLVWLDAAADRHQGALERLARRVASLGHSASLARFAFIRDGVARDEANLWHPHSNGGVGLRTTHVGRLQNLERWLANGERPLTGVWRSYRRPITTSTIALAKSMFGSESDWFLFEDAGGDRPDLLGFAHVAKCVRMALLKHAAQPPVELISGHESDGKASTKPHLAIVPLANVGWPYATGELLGFAVVLPRATEGEARRAALAAIAGFAHIAEGEDACAEVHLTSDFVWRVQRSAAPSRASLQPRRWCGASKTWASATPLLLDRYADHNDPKEEAAGIAAACQNVELPEPEGIEIHKHSAVRGAPSAYASTAARGAIDWSFPESAKFARRPRRHVVLHFAAPVEGPVVLGAGRYYGFGLCLPIAQE